MNSSTQLFLSYSRTDRDACLVLRHALEKAGLQVYTDAENNRAGDRWLERLEDALRSCSAFVVLIGQDGIRGWVGAEVQTALNRHLSSSGSSQQLPIFPVLLDGVAVESLPPFLALHQAAFWSSNETVPQSLLDSIATRTPRVNESMALEGCPFLGLNAFKRSDARLFFGRREETLDALACIGDQGQRSPETIGLRADAAYHRWLQIEGNSGSGKSSLVNAGMLPMIEQGALWPRTGFEHWQVLGPMLPGSNPLVSLAEVIERGVVEDPARRDSFDRLKRMETDERALAFALRDLRQDNGAFLLIVDQFEELFSTAEVVARRQFDALLAYALQDPDCPFFLVSTIRADFLDRFESLPRLRSIYNTHCKRYFLPLISEHGLREVIEQPARLAGLDVREVTAAILEDARDEVGALPLVESTLYALWLKRDGNRLSAEYYRKSNGIAGILSSHADGLLERINRSVPRGRQAALEVLLGLTRVNYQGAHSRQRILWDDAVFVAGGDPESGERVVNMLSGERGQDIDSNPQSGAVRLITTHTEGDRLYVDLIHETLIRARGKDALGKPIPYWSTLYEYIDKNRNREVHRQHLRIQTARWEQSKRLARFWHLAGWHELFRYRRMRYRSDSAEGRYLTMSWRVAVVQAVMLTGLAGFISEAYYWTWKNELPPSSMWTLQRFRMGYDPMPVFATIPAGRAEIGEADSEFRERRRTQFNDHVTFGAPKISVEVTEKFLLGETEVTYDQYDFFAWSSPTHGFPSTAAGGRGQHPVVNVTWGEASEYANWLGKQLGRSCRLPTESEWEYAARAGTKTAYWWGIVVRPENANYCESCGPGQAAAQNDRVSEIVRSYDANAYGLFDTAGNVSEWTCSSWTDEFDGREQRCDEESSQSKHVSRGGSKRSVPVALRSSSRFWGETGYSNDTVGFRVHCSEADVR